MTKRIELEGQRLGKLYIKEYIGKGKYHCICECSNECDIFGANLTRKHTTSCGCNKQINDLSDKTFGFLTVIERADNKKRGNTKRTMWKCLCNRCGKITNVYSDCLIAGRTISCGCLSKDKDMPDRIKEQFLDGTQISKIQSTITKANKSGVVGVNWDKSRSKWQASIKLNGHKYNLGRFDDMQDAICKRKLAEDKLFKPINEKYKKPD